LIGYFILLCVVVVVVFFWFVVVDFVASSNRTNHIFSCITKRSGETNDASEKDGKTEGAFLVAQQGTRRFST